MHDEDRKNHTGFTQSRRHDSELRLKAATNNLLRVEDVITTYEEQLAILKKQSKEAERFRNISTLIKNAEASVFYVKRNQIQTIIQKLDIFSPSANCT